jgi:hypothetical protein
MNPDMQPQQPGGVINPSQPQPNGPTAQPQMAGQDMFQPVMAPYQQPEVTMPFAQNQGQPMQPQPSFPGNPGVPQPIQPITKLPSTKKPSKKLPLIIGGALVGVLLLITVGAVLLSGGDKTAKITETPTQTLDGPQPAAAIDVEQANSAITQDVTGHDNTKDFPEDMLSDKALGL